MQKWCMLTEIVTALLSGLVSSLLVFAGLSRKLWSVQCDLSIIQAQFLKLRNAQAAGTRWKDKESLELLSDLQNKQPVKTSTDPLNKFGVKRVG